MTILIITALAFIFMFLKLPKTDAYGTPISISNDPCQKIREYMVNQYKEQRELAELADEEAEEWAREDAEQADFRYEHFDNRAAEIGALVDFYTAERKKYNPDEKEYIKITKTLLTLRNQLNTAENQRYKALKDKEKALAKLTA